MLFLASIAILFAVCALERIPDGEQMIATVRGVDSGDEADNKQRKMHGDNVVCDKDKRCCFLYAGDKGRGDPR